MGYKYREEATAGYTSTGYPVLSPGNPSATQHMAV